MLKLGTSHVTHGPAVVHIGVDRFHRCIACLGTSA